MYHLAIGIGADVSGVIIVGANLPDVTIIPPGVGDGEGQERKEVLGACQDKAIPVERRTLRKGGSLHVL